MKPIKKYLKLNENIYVVKFKQYVLFVKSYKITANKLIGELFQV